MSGFTQHLATTLRLNFRSKQALVYGYVVPIFFLLAFGSVFRLDSPPLQREMGQLLTITVLGGACFGMPTAMVAERERGVWRRYRLLPAATGGLIFSTMFARFVIVTSAAVLQIALAWGIYGTPVPEHPLQLWLAFTFVCFAFLGLGLVIAMLAETVPAVQALGQSIFLPMIMIGGVGVPLRTFRGSAAWVPHLANFLPGRYAVDAIQSCVAGPGGLGDVRWSLLALAVIGSAACLAAAKLFRWDVGQKIRRGAKWWAVPAVASWAAVGLVAEYGGRLPAADPRLIALGPATTGPATTGPATSDLAATVPAATGPASLPAPSSVESATGAAPGENLPPTPRAATRPAAREPFEGVTDAEIAGITYNDLEDDASTVTPLATSLDNLDDEGKKRVEAFMTKLADWKPGQEPKIDQRVRNMLSAAAVADIIQDQNEGEIAYAVLDQIKTDVPREKLVKALAWIVQKPDEGQVVTKLDDLGIEAEATEEGVRERVELYGKKLLGNLLGKWPRPQAP